MRRILPLFLLLSLFVVGCSSSEFATYRPAGSQKALWQIKVQHWTAPYVNGFKLIIDDSTVIDKEVGYFSQSMDASGQYRGRQVKLLVTYNSGFLGIGSGYTALVFIDNQLVDKFKF